MRQSKVFDDIDKMNHFIDILTDEGIYQYYPIPKIGKDTLTWNLIWYSDYLIDFPGIK